MRYALYFLIAIGATTVGSLTGMGGGVMIKPLMDVLGTFDASTIGLLSALTVFSMSAVSIGRHLWAKTAIPFRMAVPLAIGSVIGGRLGQSALDTLTAGLPNRLVTAVQNGALAVLILAVYLYIRNKAKIPSHRWENLPLILLTGCFLGICSSFLGIGGGPINVALMIYLFSVDTKTATVCSLVTILFAQASKLAAVAAGGGFAGFDLSAAPVMIAGAIAGGFIGAGLSKRCSEPAVERAFNGVQLLVLAIAVFNMVRNLA